MSKLPDHIAKDGEVLPPKREITFKPITRKVECIVCGKEADATFHPTCDCKAGFRSKRQAATEAIAQHPGKSDRAIAKEIGVSHPTVAAARKEVESTGKDLPVERTGLDGKTRRLPSPKPEPEPDPEPPPVLDAIDALTEAVALKNRIVHELMPLMTSSGRDQFRVVLIEEVTAASLKNSEVA